jgi:BirA family transcriptional regulator, biotin operon repressor / biotin---[acetyl-CoA-carboxylase] ligase
LDWATTPAPRTSSLAAGARERSSVDQPTAETERTEPTGDSPPAGFDAFRRELIAHRSPLFANLACLPRVASTNALGRRLASEYLREGMALPTALLIAFGQTGGRGRWGRRWESPPGLGVYASLVLAVAGADELATLPLLAAVGLAAAIDRFLAAAGAPPCRLKWPNDLLVGGRKLGGVLIESFSEGQAENGGTAAIIGFGVNHGQREAELAGLGGAREATSLRREVGSPPPLAAFAWALAEGLGRQLVHVGDAAYAAAAYAEHSLHRPGDRLRCRSGEETVEGTFLGFDRRGFLRLEVAGRELHLAAGEVAPA